MKSPKPFTENLCKNTFIVVTALVLQPVIRRATDPITDTQMGNFLLVISLLLVTVCFANFAFTYEKIDTQSFASRYLAHAATFLFMVLIALLLETTVLAVTVVYPSFASLITWFAVVLYAGIALYDIWDFQRTSLK